MMRPTPALLAKGFWSRSIDEFKRLSNIGTYTRPLLLLLLHTDPGLFFPFPLVVNLEGIKGPSGPYQLFDFREADSVRDCKLMSDMDIGGASTSELDWVSSAASQPTDNTQQPQPAKGYARFHGVISTELPKNRPDIKRTGYAGFRTQDRGATLFGRSLWDIDPYSYLALRIKSDGRAYFVNVQTESVVPTDLHQHRLFIKKPGQWETVLIRWNDFVRTNAGFVMEPQTEMMRQKVKSIGIGLTDRIPGPFELCIERIWATNDLSDASESENTPAAKREGGLKTKTGEKIGWGGQ